MIVFDLEIFYIDRAIPYANCVYRLCKNSGKYSRDITQRKEKKRKMDCIVSEGTDSLNKM